MQYSRYATKLAPVFKNKAVTTYSPSVLSLIAIIIFSVFAIHPTVKNILALQQTIDQQKKVLTDLQVKSKNLSEAVNNYNSIPEDTRLKLITLLPNSTNLTCLINDINNRSAAAGTVMNGIQIQGVDLKGTTKCILEPQDLETYRQNLPPSLDLKEINFAINTQSNFSQLSDFLASFNSSTRLMSIETANFNKSTESNLNLILSSKTFYYK